MLGNVWLMCTIDANARGSNACELASGLNPALFMLGMRSVGLAFMHSVEDNALVGLGLALYMQLNIMQFIRRWPIYRTVVQSQHRPDPPGRRLVSGVSLPQISLTKIVASP